MSIRICLAGVSGWVGRALAQAILKNREFELVSAASRSMAGRASSEHFTHADFPIFPSAIEALKTPCDVLIDYTKPDVVKSTVLAAIENRTSVVIGTSGLTDEDYNQINKAALAHSVGVLAAGNFSITAALLLKFSLEAARHLPYREIIEYGNAAKPDAPNGTMRELAFRLNEINQPTTDFPVEKTLGVVAARGATVANNQVHSIRSPGFVSSGEIIFARDGERLRITQDTLNTPEPYIAGTLLAAKKVRRVRGLVRGMDRILELP